MAPNENVNNGAEPDIPSVDAQFIFECLKNLDTDRQVSSTSSFPSYDNND